MERLHFAEVGGYDSLEAAIHLARYSLVKEKVAGKKVLDIACGEGYGAFLISQWGAKSVTGVDISPEAIANAKQNFPQGPEFICHSAERVDSLYPKAFFDVIVSLETIEHVDDAKEFLLAMKNLLAPNGILVLSCPNDWWYYPSAEQSNPYHRRKYYWYEFKGLSESILGPATQWILGGPITGFANVVRDEKMMVSADASQRDMLKAKETENALLVPVERHNAATEENASYFVGVWGDALRDSGAVGIAAIPTSMAIFSEGLLSNVGKNQQKELHEEIEQLKILIKNSEQESSGLQNQLTTTLQAHKDVEELNIAYQKEIANLQAELTVISQAHAETEQAHVIALQLQADAVTQMQKHFEQRSMNYEIELQQLKDQSKCQFEQLTEKEKQIDQIGKDYVMKLRHLHLKCRALTLENNLMQENIYRIRNSNGNEYDTTIEELKRSVAILTVPAHRYWRLASYVPVFLRKIIIKTYRGVFSGHKA